MDNPILQITAVTTPIDPYQNAAVYQSYFASQQTTMSSVDSIYWLSQFAGTWGGAQLTQALFYTTLRAKSTAEAQTIATNFNNITITRGSSPCDDHIDVIGMVADALAAKIQATSDDMVNITNEMNANTAQINALINLQNQGKAIETHFGQSGYTQEVDSWIAQAVSLGVTEAPSYRSQLLSAAQYQNAWETLTSSTGVISGHISIYTNNNTPLQLQLQQDLSEYNSMLTFESNLFAKANSVDSLIVANLKM